MPCGADFILFGGGIYGEAYYNDVHIFRLALQGKVSIPADCPHRSVAVRPIPVKFWATKDCVCDPIRCVLVQL